MVSKFSHKLFASFLLLICVSGSSAIVLAQSESVPVEIHTVLPTQENSNSSSITENRFPDNKIGNQQDYFPKYNSTQSSFGGVSSVNATLLDGCNCVVFRLDNLQDYWIPDVQVDVLDQFIQRNQSFSLGPIVNGFGDDEIVVNKTLAGYNLGLFEIAVHGWNHNDYSQETLSTQMADLQLAQDKMVGIFGNKSKAFIPPFNTFNNDTITALNATGFEIISSSLSEDLGPHFIGDGTSNIVDPAGLYHIPNAVVFVDFGVNPPFRVPTSQVLDDIDTSVDTRGYAVVTVHSEDIAQVFENGTRINAINTTWMNDLTAVIDSVLLKNYTIKTLNQVVEFNKNKANPCESLPTSGNWVITSSCTLESNFLSPSNIIIQNGTKLTIPNGVTLSVPPGSNITVLLGGGVLIEFGGTVIVVS